ncbi:MAG: endolytic transglycosylase MltG, partial [Thermoleophilaceae bacterium]
ARKAAAGRTLERRRARPQQAGDRGGRVRRRGLFAVGAVLALVGCWLLVSLFQPFKGDGEGSIAVTIPQGTNVAGIASLLERRGVVSDAFFFRARATLSGRAGDFKAGDFELGRDMSYAAAMEALVASPDANTVTITVPEGRSRTEVKEIVAGTLGGDYVAASRRSPLLDPGHYRAGSARNLEGFLFPATYELDRGSTARDLVREQLKAFKSQFEKVDLSFARRKNLTPYDVLVIASMIDREAQVARERPLVASVIYNRLSEGIPLGIDATIRFATNNWTDPLTESELSIESPYNTRTRQGLPPGPIGSPGLEALRAAARPRRSDLLFYVVKPGTCGEHAFSKTDAQFQRDVNRYNSARAERGGKSPTDC